MNVNVNKKNKNLLLKKITIRSTLFVLSLLLFFISSALAYPQHIESTYIEDLLKANEDFFQVLKRITNNLELEEAFRQKAGELWIASNEIIPIADIIHSYMVAIEALVGDVEENHDKLNQYLGEVVEYIDKYYLVVESQDGLVHGVLASSPESQQEYADVIHDTFHKIEHEIKNLSKYIQEFSNSIGVSVPKSIADQISIPEQYIRLQDKKGDILLLNAEEVCIKAHGHVCTCAATAFRATQAAISQLWEEEIPKKGELKVTYHHPGEGHNDVFEFLLEPENVNYEKAGDPKHLTLEENFRYTFIRKDNEEIWETTMKEGVIPDRFFEYRYDVKGFINGWHRTEPTEVKEAIFKQMSNDAMINILSMQTVDVFENIKKE